VSVSTSGSKTYYPTTSTIYKLMAYSEAGGQSQSLTVVVTALPPPPIPPPPTPPPPPPPVICTPGALKCIGADLYVCNTAGTEWTLKTANSPTCAAGGSTPDFWTDPVGWVIGTITKAWESMLGFVTGQFNIFLANLKSFQNNFGTQLAAFIADPLKSLRGWLDGIYASLSAIAGEVTKGISSWWETAQTSVKGWVDTAVKSSNDWIKGFPLTISTWWNSTLASVNAAIGTAVKNANDWIQTFPTTLSNWWTTTTASVTKWISTAIVDVKTWVQGVTKTIDDAWKTATSAIGTAWNNAVTGLTAFVNTQFTALKNTIEGIPGAIQGLIDTAVSGVKDWTETFVPDLVSAMFEWAKPIIKPIQDAVGFLESIAGVFTRTQPEDPVINKTRTDIKTHQDAVRELILRLK
jgi:phage-related protein